MRKPSEPTTQFLWESLIFQVSWEFRRSSPDNPQAAAAMVEDWADRQLFSGDFQKTWTPLLRRLLDHKYPLQKWIVEFRAHPLNSRRDELRQSLFGVLFPRRLMVSSRVNLTSALLHVIDAPEGPYYSMRGFHEEWAVGYARPHDFAANEQPFENYKGQAGVVLTTGDHRLEYRPDEDRWRSFQFAAIPLSQFADPTDEDEIEKMFSVIFRESCMFAREVEND